MQSAFLDEFYSISKTVAIRNKIKSFRQIPGEQFHEAFSRLKELLRTCPHHDVPKWELVKVFYDGLDYHNQQFVMATSGGTFFSRPIKEEWEFFKNLSKGSKTQASEEWEFVKNLSKGSKTQASVDQNNNHTSSANFVSNRHGINSKISELSKKVDLLLRNLGKGVPNVSQVSHNACSMCGDPSHSVNNYQSWGRQRTRRPQQNKNQGQGPSNGQQSNVDQTFDLILTNKLPSYPDLNSKHKPGGPGHVNMVISLRNGKTYNNDIKIPSAYDFSHDVEDFVTDDEIIIEGKTSNNVKSDSELVNDLLKDIPKPLTQNPKATESPKVGEGGVSSTTTPYPAALEKSASVRLAKKGPYSEDMWETFKQVKINLPLIDSIKQIPAYAKFLKDLCTQKRKLKATLPKKIDLTEHVSAVLSSSLPLKFKDPEAQLISVVVGNITIKKALLDLGASINILPASLVDNINLDRTLENLHYVDNEKELFDGMTFHEKEEEFQMIEEEFLLSLEETPLQSQQVQQPTLNEVQEYVDCLLVHQDVLLRGRGSNKGNGCVRKRSQKKIVRLGRRRKHRRVRVKIKKRKFLRSRNKKVDELFALGTITRMVASFLKTYSGNVHGKHSEPTKDH
uniref:Retrotransposon gag domain-containing protein n=1 Tax=Tanacetum cinerariifolium TaxID=118510 RepID=A0A6L2NST4_TANCI|nr:hypothetical protein [Tanacetum cinerariifolium]